jgi:hypothetical protein
VYFNNETNGEVSIRIFIVDQQEELDIRYPKDPTEADIISMYSDPNYNRRNVAIGQDTLTAEELEKRKEQAIRELPQRIENRKATRYRDANRYFVADGQDSLFVVEVKLPRADGKNQHVIDLWLNRTWSDNRIERYVNNLRKIEITTPTATTVIEGKEAMFAYFKTHRKRFTSPRNSEIVIGIR